MQRSCRHLWDWLKTTILKIYRLSKIPHPNLGSGTELAPISRLTVLFQLDHVNTACWHRISIMTRSTPVLPTKKWALIMRATASSPKAGGGLLWKDCDIAQRHLLV